jgi:hypothetical protein
VAKQTKVFLLLTAMLFLGCGGSPEQAGNSSRSAAPAKGLPDAPDACTVVTAEDIQQVLGVVVHGKPLERLQGISTTSSCAYTTTGGGASVVSILIQVATTDDPQANQKEYMDTLNPNLGADSQLKPIEGLSAPALWNPDLRQLTAFQGFDAAIFTMYDTKGQDPIEAAKALAKKALPRM